MYEFMIKKKVMILHSTEVLQQLLEMNGRKLQRSFVYILINILGPQTICPTFYLFCIIYSMGYVQYT
jgi:hypothetical protein